MLQITGGHHLLHLLQSGLPKMHKIGNVPHTFTDFLHVFAPYDVSKFQN